MAIIGFDFGTTNSLISMIKGDRAISFLDGEGLPTPSVVCYEGSHKIVGREAKERLSEAGLGVMGNIVRSPKMYLGKESIFIDGVERSPVDIVAEIVRYVCNQALSSQRGKGMSSIKHAVVTIPVNMEGYRRAALRDAFRMAGIGIVQFIHEPHAALYGYLRSGEDYAGMVRRYDRQVMLVFDWGGGTLDLTLCRLVDGMLVQLKNDGPDDVGGDKFDEILRNEVIRKVMINRGFDESVSIQPEAKTRLLHRCERAKIDLSTRGSVELYVGSFFRGVTNEELDFTLRREEFEGIVAPLLDKGLGSITKLLDAANISPAQVSLCLATGGMANMPAIKERLHELFGPQRVHISKRSGSLIAEGAAWVAHDKAKLHLAKNIELLLARNAPMPLVKAGTELPREGEVKADVFHLYCADPRDGFAKFQLQAPVRPGSKVLPTHNRDILDVLVVDVDSKARPFRERLELDIKIDDNLIFHAQARSLEKGGLAETAVHALEFGLSLPSAPCSRPEAEDSEAKLEGSIQEAGALVVRSNITRDVDDRLVPGELLYSFKPGYFDSRSNPPQYQIEEKLYYEPCAVCKRASSDPLCHCNS